MAPITCSRPRIERHCLLALLLGGLLPCLAHADDAAALALLSETSNHQRSGEMDEVHRVLEALERQHPREVRRLSWGTSPEGRAMPALLVGDALEETPTPRPDRPVVLLMGGMHAGEVDGKDALLGWLRDLLASGQRPLPIAGWRLLVVPVVNVDGHEARNRHHRPNQDRPIEQGTRTTGRRLNLNRDHMIADAPEMRSLLQVAHRWDPRLIIDFHVTDGVRLRHTLAISTGPQRYGDEALSEASQQWTQALLDGVRARGERPLPFYPRLVDRNDPGRGLILDIDEPRYSHAYWGLRHRTALLVELHSWVPFERRVQAARAFLDTLAEMLSSEVARAAVRAQSTAESRSLAHRATTLEWQVTPLPTASAAIRPPVDIDAWEYTVEDAHRISGGRTVRYRTDRPAVWRLPLYDTAVPVSGATVNLPGHGYVIPAAWADLVAPVLQRQGVRYERLEANRVAAVERFAFDAPPELARESFQGRQRVRLRGQWQRHHATQTLGAGALVVPIGQPLGLLAAHLLEPAAPDALIAWGFFNTIFENSEMRAAYRDHELVEWMHDGSAEIERLFGESLAAQLPQLRESFERRLATDRAFAADPHQRLRHYLQHLPPYDQGLDTYPVVRVDIDPR